MLPCVWQVATWWCPWVLRQIHPPLLNSSSLLSKKKNGHFWVKKNSWNAKLWALTSDATVASFTSFIQSLILIREMVMEFTLHKICVSFLPTVVSWQDTWCSKTWASRLSATLPPRSVRIQSLWGWSSTRERSNMSTTFVASQGNTCVQAGVHVCFTNHKPELKRHKLNYSKIVSYQRG